MPVLGTEIQTGTKDFNENKNAMKALVDEMRERKSTTALGGSERAREKHTQRGKLLVRERIELVTDAETPFLELSELAAFDMYEGASPSAGIVTGIGTICGTECMIVANDATVKGGTYFPMTVKKHLRAQEIARENHLPCLYLVDSGGAFLPLQACLLYTSPSPRDLSTSRMPSSA